MCRGRKGISVRSKLGIAHGRHCTANRQAHKRPLIAPHLVTRTLWDRRSWDSRLSIRGFSGRQWAAVLPGAPPWTAGRGPFAVSGSFEHRREYAPAEPRYTGGGGMPATGGLEPYASVSDFLCGLRCCQAVEGGAPQADRADVRAGP